MKLMTIYPVVKMKTVMKVSLLFCVLSFAVPHAKGQKAESNVRISWDYNTYQEMASVYVANKGFVEGELHYPRVKRLSDGSLLMTFSNDHYGWNIYARRSEDNGKTWSDAQMLREKYKENSTAGDDEVVFVNPEFIELQDGRIMLAYQWRYKKGYHDIPNTNENCGVEIMFSNDKGKTFSSPRRMYRGRCWEPAMLQLPSGEIHMYITSSQEVVNKVSNPRTVVIRSFDGGKTWQGKKLATYKDAEPVSRSFDERSSYDGMPTAVWLDDNKGIAMPIEVWSGRFVVDQTPMVVKTDADVNWRGDQKKIANEGGPEYPYKKQLNKDFVGYGPYSTKLKTGEVVVISNGQYKGEQGIWAFIGDKKADNFRFATSPFVGHWGSIDDIGGNKVIVSGTANYKDASNKERAKVLVMTGRLNYSKDIAKGDLSMPAVAQFDKDNNDYWFLGKKTQASTFTNFGYTNESLIIGTYYFDRNIVAFTPENSDASILLLSRKNKKGGYDNYKIAVNAQGKYTVYHEENYSWRLIHKGVTSDVEVVGTINNGKDKDLGYSAKLKIDWALLGGAPTADDVFRAHLRLHYKDRVAEKPLALQESMAGENSDYPEEWLPLIFR